MRQHITLAEVKTAGREYYSKGMLTAQHPDPTKRECFYRIGDHHCVIGAALTADTLDAIELANLMNMGIFAHDMKKFIDVDESEANDLNELQMAHDVWAQRAYGANYNNPNTDEAHDRFYDLLFAD